MKPRSPRLEFRRGPGRSNGREPHYTSTKVEAGRREAAHKPAEQEEDCAGEKDGKTRRVVPGTVDILTDVEQGPKEERACAET